MVHLISMALYLTFSPLLFFVFRYRLCFLYFLQRSDMLQVRTVSPHKVHLFALFCCLYSLCEEGPFEL